MPLKEKVAYCAGSVTGSSGFIIESLSNPIFVLLFGLSPSLMSLLSVGYRVYDAFTDAVMGWISDNTRTRWGRRRPYIFLGAVLTGIWLPMMWMFSREWSQPAIIAWMIVCWIGLYTFQTIFNIPWQSLFLEMSKDTQERASISSLRSYFGIVMGLSWSWLWFLTQLPIFHDAAGKPDTLNGARWLCSGIGLIMIAGGVWAALGTKERYYHQAAKQAKISLRETFRLTLQNKPFLILGLFTLFFFLGSYLKSGLAFWIKLYYVCEGDKVLAAKIAGIEGTMSVISALIGVRFFQWLAKRRGPVPALKVCMWVVFTGSLSTFFFYTPHLPYLAMTSTIPLSMATSGLWLLIPVMTADVVDFDELQCRERREGAFAAIYSWIVKLSFGVGAGLSGPLVDLVGFKASYGQHQPEDVLFWGRALLIVLPAVFIGAAIYILHRYPLTLEKMKEVRAQLTERNSHA